MSDIYDRLEALETLGIKFGLDNIRQILSALHNPERKYDSILIAGTNGKGSVGAMLEAALTKNGLPTGHYLSPHLVDVRERIRVHGRQISREAFEDVLSKVFHVAERLRITPTYFETLTAAGLLHFAEAGVQCAVIEVGMGGRWDATNSVPQVLSIITNIGFDHEAFLGKTLDSIATEKAMISKNGVPMITGTLPDEARNAVARVCAITGSPLATVDPTNIVDVRFDDGFPVFHYAPWKRTIRLGLRGRHQLENASVALLALTRLREIGWKIEQEPTIQGLAGVRWPGRLEIVPGVTPMLLLDCAHNPMGTTALLQFMADMQWEKATFIFTAMKDKNFAGMLKLVAPFAGSIVLCRVEPLDRCATEEDLTEAASNAGLKWMFEPDPAKALRMGLALSQSSGLPLIAFGSIYLIGRLFSTLGMAT